MSVGGVNRGAPSGAPFLVHNLCYNLFGHQRGGIGHAFLQVQRTDYK